MPPAQAQQPLTDEELKKALETLLFITDRPLGSKELCKITGVKDEPRVVALIAELKAALDAQNSAVQLLEVAEGYQMATRPSFAPFVRKLFSDRMTMKLSTAAHETLSIVAYKQPLTRAEIEQVRGVEVIAALETLLEKRLIKVVGRKETVGRPLMYGTTPDFLRHFGLKSLEALPPLENFAVEPTLAAGKPADAPSEAPADAAPETTTEAWEAAAEAAPEPASEAPAPQMKNLWGDEAAEETK